MRDTIWKPVMGFETDYEISSAGEVRRTTAGPGARAGHILRPCITKAGYRQVALRRDGKTFTKLVCQLVCETFHGPRPAGMEVRHLDGDSLNDFPWNLTWGTHFENMQDIKRHGTNYNATKTHCKNGHEFTAGNTLTREEGRRRCRTCTLESSRRSKQLARSRRAVA